MTIDLENITKEYHGEKVLENVNASIEWGKCYGFVGKHCGKSALLRIFMGMEKPDSGKVHLMGDYKYPTLHSAYVSQHGQLNEKKSAIWNVKKAYKRFGNKGVIDALSHFLADDRMKLAVSELTQVEQRQVELVCACVTAADFFVFDEPFAGMSDEERAYALDYILEVRGSRPLLIATEHEEQIQGIPGIKVYHL